MSIDVSNELFYSIFFSTSYLLNDLATNRFARSKTSFVNKKVQSIFAGKCFCASGSGKVTQ